MHGQQTGLARFFQEKPLMVLVLLVALLVLDPFFPNSFARLSFLTIAVITAWLASRPGGAARKAIAVLSLAVAGSLLYVRFSHVSSSMALRDCIGIALLVLALILYVLCGGLVLSSILKAKNVTHHLIIAAVNLYILLGVCWAHLYTLLDWLDPGAFSLAANPSDSASHFIYFSFVTLASLGYGDITPKTEFAQRIAIIEAIMGQFYGSVIVAYLVSVYIGQSLRVNAPLPGTHTHAKDKDARDEPE